MVFVLPLWVMPHSMGLTYAYALLKGGAEERIIASAETGYMALCTVLSVSTVGPADLRVNLVATSIEFAIALWVALRSDRLWPMAYASIVLVSLLTLVAASLLRAQLWAYGTATFVWNYGELLVLGCGAYRASRARRVISHVRMVAAA